MRHPWGGGCFRPVRRLVIGLLRPPRCRRCRSRRRLRPGWSRLGPSRGGARSRPRCRGRGLRSSWRRLRDLGRRLRPPRSRCGWLGPPGCGLCRLGPSWFWRGGLRLRPCRPWRRRGGLRPPGRLRGRPRCGGLRSPGRRGRCRPGLLGPLPGGLALLSLRRGLVETVVEVVESCGGVAVKVEPPNAGEDLLVEDGAVGAEEGPHVARVTLNGAQFNM